jgi:hypothetical protein
MLQKLCDHIAHCLAQASIAELRVSEASNETLRSDYERIAKTWRHLASSYQFVESLERFLIDADRARRAVPPEPANENGGRALLLRGAFDPETIATLIAAYDNAIESQPASAREAIARSIIELASDGERDPRKLCLGALDLSDHGHRAQPESKS